MRAVLAGSGGLGTRVGRRLAAAGHDVLGLCRRPERLPHGFAGQAVDLRRESPALPVDTGVVVVALTADDRTADSYAETFRGGAEHLIRAIEREFAVPEPPVADTPFSRGNGKRCRNDRLRASGFTVTYPTFREGYRAMVAAEDR